MYKYRILFTSLPTNDLGLQIRSLPIAKELSKRGHTIVFSNPANAPKKIIEAAGFHNIAPIHPLYEIGFSNVNFSRLLFSRKIRSEYGGLFEFAKELIKTIPYKSAPLSNEVWDMNHAFAITGLLNKKFIEAQCKAYIRVIEEANVHAIIDFWNPFACIASKILSKPLITVNQGDALPDGKGFIWWKPKSGENYDTVPVVNAVLEKYGVKKIHKIEDLNIGDLTLVVGMPLTDPLENKERYQYIGPVLWENPDLGTPEWLDHLPADKPVIWLYPGNPQYTGKSKIFNSDFMLKACMDALSTEAYHVVLSLGYQKIPKSFILPKNFQVVSYVPGTAMAKRSDLMIHHGGYGSCQTGLSTGTPALIIPTFSERESNARRIANLGAGEFILPKTNKNGLKYVDAEEIRTKTEKMLSVPEYRMNAMKYGQMLNSYGGPSLASDFIERFLDSIRDPRPSVRP